MVASYLALIELAKRWFYRSYGARERDAVALATGHQATACADGPPGSPRKISAVVLDRRQ